MAAGETITMLEVSFFNVGDGDAVLIREFDGKTPLLTVLVDAGRPFLEPVEGSLRKEAVDHLLNEGISRIDRLILTHLHIDHVGGAGRILETIRTRELDALYLPPEGARRIAPEYSSTEKTRNGLLMMLNIFRETTEKAKAAGCSCRILPEGEIMLSDRLGMRVIYPRSEIRLRQKRVFDALYSGQELSPEEVRQAAKERNLSSLMLLLSYAGRRVLLTGDRFASDWENEETESCDILKLPHHGDGRSMTETLLQKLSPQYAVISCQNDPDAKKDRPNEEVAEMLLREVPSVLCTENRKLRALEASTHNVIRFCIEDDGSTSCRPEN